MVTPHQGEIWWADAEDKRRPVLIVSRSGSAAVLNRIVCAPVTRSIRGIPTEIALGKSEGFKTNCVASFDNLQLVRRASLAARIGSLSNPHRLICKALSALADC
jgi:mRNA interferase MazF